ncbi:ABC transporter substrate-binding protein [Actinobacteria bacterium YIM 96077]|uniref:ABC transporter substrate-binding protein n=2 Tax=Phytoactinopolyspora halophila TaxID=1981511 RepID=A0A329QDX6_9ACTN|nr:ABC transporter substrate-binding protein [Actinobacteria bacterium YIM 96077]RAW10625.1 ABC transporter substrate-binding protein [Phytoactinopolyspora halophila]
MIRGYRVRRRRHPLPGACAILAALVLATGAACSGEQGGAAHGREPRTVDACPEPVEGFAVSVDGDGQPLEPADPSENLAGRGEQADPRSLSGRTTAELDNERVHPVVDAPAPELPVEVASCDGEIVEIDDASRILAVDLYGTLAEIVFSLGLGDRVVGRDISTGFPRAENLPVVTPGGHDLNAEAVLELNPTVVLTDSSIGPPEVHQQLRDAGIPVVFFDDSRTIDGIPSQIRAVAGALGVPDAAEALIDRTEGEIAGAMAMAPDDVEPLRIAFLYTRGGMVQLLAGPGSGADAMIRAIGAVDVGTDIGLDQPFTQITSEALIEAQPDVVIMMTKGLESIGGVEGMAELPGLAQTPAGEHRRVVDMDDAQLLSFGPRTGATIAALAEAVYAP